MSGKEIYDLALANVGLLKVHYNYDSELNKNNPYHLTKLGSLRGALKRIADIPFLKEDIIKLVEIKFFDISEDSLSFTYTDYNILSDTTYEISIALSYFIKYYKTELADDEFSLNIRLPEISTFSDLAKISGDFKKAIEIPLLDSKIESDLKITHAARGSILLYVSLGTTLAVSLIGSIVWSAAVIRRKRAETKIYEAHTRTLELKNEMMEIFIEAQKKLVEETLDNEAQSILSERYKESSAESLERLKLSISTVSDLIDKGARILPTSTSNDLKQLFPDYDKLSLIQSAIKKIS